MPELFLYLIAASLISFTISEKFLEGPVNVAPEEVFDRNLRRPGNLVPSFVRIGKRIPHVPKGGIQGMKRDGGGPSFRHNLFNDADFAKFQAYLAMRHGINLRNFY